MLTARQLVVCCVIAAGCGDAGPAVAFVTDGDYLAKVGDDGPERIYVKAMNLGVGIPGTYPGELALDRETYLRWFARMNEIGFNTVRVYTLHHPAFYSAVFEYNNFRPDRPLYILHGAWLDEDNPTGGLDLYDFTESLDTALEEVIDAVHGNAEIEHRLGKGFGSYDVDISRWVIGYIVGREVYASEAITSNAAHPEDTSYQGEYVSIENVTPTEAWATARLDHALTYEADRYRVQRPIAFSSWPTLDPISHETEPHFVSLGGGLMNGAGEDDAQIDITKIDASRAKAGLFASYHAYPYYPNFIYRDPAYVNAEDAEGTNNYVGYLRELKAHYSGIPLMISEYGVPSSWGNAHFAPPAGMHHGGHSETEQAVMLARMTRNIAEAGCAGGAAFAWMDEWWKRTWIVATRTYPIERYPLWRDVTSPEEHYGVLAYEVANPTFTRFATTSGAGRISSVDADVDSSFFHLRVGLSSPLADGEVLELGFDTYDDDLGDSLLPSGASANGRAEIALVVTAPDQAQVMVTEGYDLHGFRFSLNGPEQARQSVTADGGEWHPWRWITSINATSDDGQYFYPMVTHNQGALRARRVTGEASSLDAVIISDDVVEIRVPWTLLQFSDPSALEVVHDDLATERRLESAPSEGIRVTAYIGADNVTTGRLRWDPWDEAPQTIEREKPAVEALAEALIGL